MTQNKSDSFDFALRRIIEKTDQKRLLERQLKELNREINSLNDYLAEQFAAKGYQNIKKDGRTVFVRHDTSVSVKPECREQALELAQQHGWNDMITVQPSRLRSHVKELIDQEGGLPPDLEQVLNVYEYSKVVIRNS